MAINPPSDIVLDVARNADGGLAATATRRLEALARPVARDLPSFGSTLKGVSQSLSQSGAHILKEARLPSRPQGGVSLNGVSRERDVALQFEAMLLGAFVNDALPKNMSTYYGQGAAGEIWKSMLSDQIGHQLAKSGSLGIARRLFATHPLNETAARGISPVSPGMALHDAVQSSSLPLSMPPRLDLSVGGMALVNRRRSRARPGVTRSSPTPASILRTEATRSSPW